MFEFGHIRFGAACLWFRYQVPNEVEKKIVNKQQKVGIVKIDFKI